MQFIGNKNLSNRSGIGSKKWSKLGIKSGQKNAIFEFKNHLLVQQTIDIV